MCEIGVVGCGSYIANNVSGAHIAILYKKLQLVVPGPPFYLPFALLLGAFVARSVHFCVPLPPWGAFCTPFCPCCCTGSVFIDFGDPRGVRNACRRHRRGRLWWGEKTAIGPSGRGSRTSFSTFCDFQGVCGCVKQLT